MKQVGVGGQLTKPGGELALAERPSWSAHAIEARSPIRGLGSDANELDW